ncbi:Alpha/Beta hydrolase protein [Cantharellus anzutake]|uniref:Alpha/Beta hydrolase protein n=1 Tax=Cantharellus anzutake TaxID=1750568 RepID=UPI001907671D|nr:Alpha/Beta hydrolase protein [Cantharellus anzutake]KAF8336942.1 Alpha/Beta hydrolase protein [Cantharellus anzutake]
MSQTSFTSKFVSIGQRSIHVRLSEPAPPPNAPTTKPPVIFLHAVGSNSSSWVTPLLMAPQLAQHRQLVLFDSDGHGLSPWSGRDQMTVVDLLHDLLALLNELQFRQVAIVAHSLFCHVASLFALNFPARTDKLLFLHPIRYLTDAMRGALLSQASHIRSMSPGNSPPSSPLSPSMMSRMTLPPIRPASTPAALSSIAVTTSTSSISRHSLQTNYSAQSLIHRLVLSTHPSAYAATQKALVRCCFSSPLASEYSAGSSSTSPSGLNLNVNVTPQHCEMLIVGGEEDDLASPELLRAWVEEVQLQRGQHEFESGWGGQEVWRKGKRSRTSGSGAGNGSGVKEIILKDVGHWACVEEPLQMSRILLSWGMRNDQ